MEPLALFGCSYMSVFALQVTYLLLATLCTIFMSGPRYNGYLNKRLAVAMCSHVSLVLEAVTNRMCDAKPLSLNM